MGLWLRRCVWGKRQKRTQKKVIAAVERKEGETCEAGRSEQKTKSNDRKKI